MSSAPGNAKGFSRYFNRGVSLRPNANHRSLKQHFRTGTCVHDLVGYLELQAARNPERVIFTSVDTLVIACKGRFRKPHPKPHSKREVQYALAGLQAEGILSPYLHNVRVTFDGWSEPRKGWVLAPHDFLFDRRDHNCIFHGFEDGLKRAGLPVPLSGPRIWFPWPPTGAVRCTTDGSLWIRPRCVNGALPVHPHCTDSACPVHLRCVEKCMPWCAEQCVDISLHSVDTVAPLDDTANVFTELKNGQALPSLASLTQLVSLTPIALLSTTPPTAPAKPDEDYSKAGLLTDEKRGYELRSTANRSAPAGAAPTVTAHFADASDYVRQISDGELREENSSMRNFRNWDGLRAACRDAVQQNGSAPLRSRKDLASLMQKVLDIFDEQGDGVRSRDGKENRYPKAWLRIIAKLNEGGPIILRPDGSQPTDRVENFSYEHELCYGWLNRAFHPVVRDQSIDLEPYEKSFVPFRDDNWSFSDAWKFIHFVLAKELTPLPSNLAKLRDSLFERDATSEKPAKPPWLE